MAGSTPIALAFAVFGLLTLWNLPPWIVAALTAISVRE